MKRKRKNVNYQFLRVLGKFFFLSQTSAENASFVLINFASQNRIAVQYCMKTFTRLPSSGGYAQGHREGGRGVQ